MVTESIRTSRGHLIAAWISVVLNLLFTIFLFAPMMFSQSFRTTGEAHVHLIIGGIFMGISVLSYVAVIGVRRHWDGVAIVALLFPGYLVISLMALGALAVTIFGPV